MESGSDLISELPDPIIHHILSFLDMKHAIVTSLLSTRWKDLWATLPVLNFNKKVYEGSEDLGEGEEAMNLHDDNGGEIGRFEEVLNHEVSDEEMRLVHDIVDKCERFVAFVDRVLSRRRGVNLQSFRLSCENSCLVHDINRWIVTAIRCNVEVLDLQINQLAGYYLKLPSCLFTSKSLTTLKLDMRWEMNAVFHVPDSVDLPLLKSLYLRSVSFIGGDSMGDFFSKCVSLESLFLSKCTILRTNRITISAVQLKELMLDDLYFVRSFTRGPLGSSDLSYCRVTICAPNLTSFSCRDFVLNDYSLVNISSLVNADIDMDLESYYYSVIDLELPEFFIEDVIKCLKGLSHVRSLTISAWLLEVIIDVPDGLHSMRTTFSNLHYLKLKTNLCGAQSIALTYMLGKCPSLETLVLEMTQGPRTRHVYDDEEIYKAFDSIRWEEELLPQWNMSSLKFVQIREVQGNGTELAFLKFLLKNAAALEKVLVFKSKSEPPNKSRFKKFTEKLMKVPKTKFKKFTKKLMKVPRASSSIELSFL